jgi:hypothetical protein
MTDPAVIAALIAFAATLFVSWYDKHTEKKNTNKAIRAEIHRLLAVMKRHYDWAERRNPKFPLIPFSTPVYNENAKNIGWVHKDIVEEVVKFYGYLGYINALQTTRKDYISAGIGEEFNNQYERSLENLLRDFRGKF